MCRLIGASVADDGTGGDGFDLCDDGFPGQGWAQIDVFSEEFCADVAFGGRPHAIAGDAGANEFAVRIGPQDAGGRVGNGAKRGFEAVCGQNVVVFVEDTQLFVGEAVIGRIFDIGEVRAGAFEDDVWEFAHVSDEFEGFGDEQSLALRTGFEFDDAADGFGSRRAGGTEGIDLRFVVDHDAHIEIYCGFGMHRGNVSHDEQVAVVAVIAQILSFVQRVHAKPGCAALDEGAPGDLDAVSVSIGFDDGGDFSARSDPFFQGFHVVSECYCIDEAAAAMKSNFLWQHRYVLVG